MSNVIMAFLSIVNAVPGADGHPIGHPTATLRTGPPRPRTRPIADQLIRPLTVAALIGVATLLRHRFLRWGATTQEQRRALAGDGVLPAADVSTTRSITINAEAADVWPWIAQLGQGRGGFYSYDWLENLIPGMDIHTADRIVPEWQHVAVGDEVRLAPEVPLTVVVLEPERALALRGSVPMGGVAPPYDFTWAFVLLPRPDGTTRLVVRERYAYTRRWASLIVQPATMVSCLMTPKMLRGIKSRVEQRTPRAVLAPSLPMPDGDATANPISAAR